MKITASALCIILSAAIVTPLLAQTLPDPMVCKEKGRVLTDREVFVLVLRETFQISKYQTSQQLAVDLSSDEAINAYIDANPDCCYRNRWPGHNPNGSFNGLFGEEFDERYSRSQGVAHFTVETEYPITNKGKKGEQLYSTKKIIMNQCGGFAYTSGYSFHPKWSPGRNK